MRRLQRSRRVLSGIVQDGSMRDLRRIGGGGFECIKQKLREAYACGVADGLAHYKSREEEVASQFLEEIQKQIRGEDL